MMQWKLNCYVHNILYTFQDQDQHQERTDISLIFSKDPKLFKRNRSQSNDSFSMKEKEVTRQSINPIIISDQKYDIYLDLDFPTFSKLCLDDARKNIQFYWNSTWTYCMKILSWRIMFRHSDDISRIT